MNRKKIPFFIKLPYWLGIGADAFWSFALLIPSVYGALIGDPGFNPDLRYRLIMAVGGVLMAGWTILLIWALRDPIERRFIILLTAFPVVFGLFVVSLISFIAGNTGNIWIVVKTAILFLLMGYSYYAAGKFSEKGDANESGNL
ncbi:MAG: hypothetical protein OEZ34_12015 [Spirochaetia bacterium]|nr:hypothetical protein [Spirochaetia bacterium]